VSSERKNNKPKRAVDHDLIRELARLLDEVGLTEIEFERDGQRVRVARHPAASIATVSAAARTTTPLDQGGHIEPGSPDPTKHPGLVSSPMSAPNLAHGLSWKWEVALRWAIRS
jgi:acetyl-CoA carboxylase biotin carboxyl carrier protein